MTVHFDSEILIVGAGPVGAYLGWKLASSGCRVLLLDSRPLDAIGQNIEIFHMDQIRFDEFDIPHPTKEELIHLEEVNYNWSPDLKIKQPVRYPIYVMYMPAFIQRMQRYASDAGATLLENARVEGVIVENGKLVGVWPYKWKLTPDTPEVTLKGTVPYKIPPWVIEKYKK